MVRKNNGLAPYGNIGDWFVRKITSISCIRRTELITKTTKFRAGFTLIEMVISMGIMAIAFAGVVAAYIACFDLAETAKNTTYALNAAQKKIEEIRDYNFANVFTAYDNTTFTVDGISTGNSNALVEIDNSNPDLLVLTVTACWRQRSGRVVGGDAALAPSSSSPARLVTYIADR